MPNKRLSILVLAMGVCIRAYSATGDGNPTLVERPAPVHKFLDAKNISLQSLDLLIMAADIASTRRALQIPGTSEANPLARSDGAIVGLRIAGVGAGLGIAYLMHRSGHHKVERVIPLITGAPSALAAVHNTSIHR